MERKSLFSLCCLKREAYAYKVMVKQGTPWLENPDAVQKEKVRLAYRGVNQQILLRTVDESPQSKSELTNAIFTF